MNQRQSDESFDFSQHEEPVHVDSAATWSGHFYNDFDETGTAPEELLLGRKYSEDEGIEGDNEADGEEEKEEDEEDDEDNEERKERHVGF